MIANFDAKLREYARLIVEIGLNLQPGQTPRIQTEIEGAPLARLCVDACYDLGARQVLCDFSDGYITRQTYLRADEATFSEYPSYMKAKLDWLLDIESPSLSLTGSDPELLKGVDPARIRARQIAADEPTRPYYDAMMASRFPWCGAAYASAAWARKVFPSLSEGEAIDALWKAIFTTCRVTGDGQATARWRAHNDAVARRAATLNAYAFTSLRYHSENGTDLTVALPQNHIWAGGSEKSASGIVFTPNMPTEEIFTAPRRDGVNGIAVSALPLSLGGQLVRDFRFEFQGGKIVSVSAVEGEETLREAISLDEGASYLGEVALVPYHSPIRATGLTFYNTLFDENASCHLAFGAAYPTCVAGGGAMSEEEQRRAGLNQSMTHVDFMIGTRDLNITGTTPDGREIPVFVDGNFAF